jgi:hypothetical protein
MIDQYKKLVRDALKKWGDDAPAHFGIQKGRLEGYIKRGNYPPSLMGQIIAEEGLPRAAEEQPTPQPEPQPPPPPPMYPPTGQYEWPVEPVAPPVPPQGVQYELMATNKRVGDIVSYIQNTIDLYIKQFAARIAMLERQFSAVRTEQLRAAGAVRARPDQGVPVDQVFTTSPLGNALDTGIAPTREQVEAQANMTIIEGVPVPGGQLARPAEFIPNQPSFGFNWNIPRPRK